MLIDAAALRRVAFEIVKHGGSEDAEATIVSDHLVRANLAGHDSHGVGMLPAYVRNLQAKLLNPNTAVALIKDEGSIMVFDGQWGYGQRVAKEMMEAALERCKSTGVVVSALRQAHHIGRIGSYGEQSIAAGMVSLHFVNVIGHNPLVAAFGGAEARFVTNPICLAMPGTDNSEPIVLDMATSRIAAGKVRVALNKGEQVMPDALIDHQGQATTDPKAIFEEPKGALLPFGQHKGYGLALFCELFAGALAGGNTIQPGNERHQSIINSMLTIIIDPKKLVDENWMKAEIDALVDYVKSSRTAAGVDAVMVAGDPERKAMAKRNAEGIPVDETTWEQMLEAGEALGFSQAEANRIAGVS